jgi:uncharacterized protein YybS (DUF2232 family)
MPQSDQQKQQHFFSGQSLLTALLFFLPSAAPSVLAWLIPLLAVPVFLLLQAVNNDRQALRLLRNGLLTGGAGALLLDSEEIFLFSLIQLSLAWSLRRSAVQKKSPAAAGGAGLAMLGLSWLAFWFCYGILSSSNPYSSLLAELQNGLSQLAETYRTSSAQLSAEMLYSLELTTAWLRQRLPVLLPGLLISGLTLTVWLNMLISSWLLGKVQPGKAPWQEYRCWRLPDQLIWLLIAGAAVAAVGTGRAQTIGFTLAAVAALIYFFQGAAVFSHLLHCWKVPPLWRFFLYFIVAAQSYGVLLLTVTGVADTWADFRKLAQDKQDSSQS